MKDSKPKSLNKNRIIIYQMTLLDKFLCALTALGSLGLPISALIINAVDFTLEVMVFLLAAIGINILMYFSIFKEYICLDIKNNKLIIRESPGFWKEELLISDVLSIKISDGTNTRDFFTIDIETLTCTKKIYSWSTPPSSRTSIVGRRIQRQRLEKFCEECNAYLESRDKKS
jgi:hypothetical protein